MRIVTWHSETARPDARWVAQFEVAVKPAKPGERTPKAQNPEAEIIGGGRPDPTGFLPIIFRGPTEPDVISRARAHWDGVIAEEARKREVQAERVAKARASRATQAEDAVS
jgi:hypothetical protein